MDSGASLDGAVNHALHLVELVLAHESAVFNALLLGSTKLHALHLGNELLHEGIVDRGLDVDTLGAIAHLAGEDDAGGHDGIDGLVKVGISHDNARGLAAELKADLAHVDGSIGHNLLAGGNGSGHTDDAGDGAGSQCFSDGVAVASDDTHNARREVELTGLDSSRDVRHELEAGEGSELGSLDNDGASGQKSGSNLTGHDEEGEVPRANSNADAKGSVVHVDVLADVVGLDDLSLPAVSETSVVLVVAGDGICGAFIV